MTESKQIGDQVADGTIYVGVSPLSRKPMYATPADAPGLYDGYATRDYGVNLRAHGHNDFRVPDKSELQFLYYYRDQGKLAGTFNTSVQDGNYWTSDGGRGLTSFSGVWAKNFGDGGSEEFRGVSKLARLRCIRYGS